MFKQKRSIIKWTVIYFKIKSVLFQYTCSGAQHENAHEPHG